MSRRSRARAGLRRASVAASLLTVGLLCDSAAALPRLEAPPMGRPGEPGSGLPRDEAGKGDRDRLKPPKPLRPEGPEELEALGELEMLYDRYERATKVAGDTAAHVLTLEAEAARAALGGRYEAEIDRHLKAAAQLREQAIARYRAFIDKHPDDPLWTAELTFRLAELHYEAESERYAKAERDYEELIAAKVAAANGEAPEGLPPAPVADYRESITLYRDVATRFPRFAHIDAALYMMGLLHFEADELDESRQALLALTCAERFPIPAADGSNLVSVAAFKPGDYSGCAPIRAHSKLVAESWLRVGEIHYDLDELDPALEAYTEATGDPDDPLYDEALIRVAWTLYLQRRFADAAGKLDDFVRYADDRRGKEEAEGATALRDDAVRYIAKCYVEDDWDGDGAPDRPSGFARLDRDYSERGEERHVPEIYAALGDLVAGDSDFQQAIRIYETALQRWPLAAAAPKLQKKIMDAYAGLRDQDGVLVAREALAASYIRGTQWFYANESKPDVIEEAMALVEEALVATAVERHARAQKLRADGDPAAADEYRKAAVAYEAYLGRYPDGPNSYQYRYDYAESLFYSGQFLPAAEAYVAVRDSGTEARLQADAAEGALFAYEAAIEAESTAGRLTIPDMPKKDQVGEGPYEAKEIPALLVAQQEAYDRYVSLGPDPALTPSIKYKAAAISQRYFHFKEAERRFVRILDEHCDDNAAISAGFAILDAYVLRGDLAGTREWTQRLLDKGCGTGEESQKFAGDLKTLDNAVRFEEANVLFEQEEFEAAADRYIALVDEAPKDPNADRALNNAAVAYERIGRFKSASEAYKRIYTDYPDSELADDALLRSGLNHVRFFEYDDAVKAYLMLAEDARFAASEHRDLALKNAADLLDSTQQYKKSSELYLRYAGKASDPAEQAEASFRAAQVLRKTDDDRAIEAAFLAFVGKYGSDPSQAERVVEAHLRIGQARAGRGDGKGAEKAYQESIALFNARGLKVATEAADYPSEAQFLLSEYTLSGLLDFKLTGRGKALTKNAKELFDRVVEASKSYDAVLPYRRIEWVLAAMYRRAYAFEVTAIKMREAPVPRELKQYSEPWFAYKDAIETAAQKFEEMAIPLYEETVKRGREYGVESEWTKRARERINIYKPEEYPLLHEPAVELQLEDRR
ncbi:MAG: tetratricopeptide repeat protein [Myxococcales bacterium]|nr:tetratricopeptide repeat protein [Myxococcales bacterium]